MERNKEDKFQNYYILKSSKYLKYFFLAVFIFMMVMDFWQFSKKG